MTGLARFLILVVALAVALSGCLKTLQGAVGTEPEMVWETPVDFEFSYAVTDAVAAANPNGVVREKNFTLPMDAELLRLGFTITLDSPGNVTVRLNAPDTTAYEESFQQPGEVDKVVEVQAPAPGQWHVTVEALGQGAASVRVDARMPATT